LAAGLTLSSTTEKLGRSGIVEPMKPATDKAWSTWRKLQELVERGIGGERDSAAKKLARLEAQFDFSVPEDEGENLFSGTFARSESAEFLTTIPPNETDIGAFIKWAIENATGLPTLWRQDGLWIEAESESLRQLRHIADVIRRGFSELWQTFAKLPDTKANDRRTFMLGLYDGMMSDEWQKGKPLPTSTPRKQKKTRAKKRTLAKAPAIALHPYSVALDMGRRIRLSVPLESINAELQDRIALEAAA
jgi:hypothetical protein